GRDTRSRAAARSRWMASRPATIHGVRSVPLSLGLAIAVATVLADSSVVVLALPDLLSSFDVSIERVAWVITAFNLALAVFAVPAGAGRVAAVGLACFAAASAACAAAGNFDLLIAARCVQAVSGAAVVCAGLALMQDVSGSRRRGATAWAAAAAVGAALGPAAGGALTQAFTWRGVFAAQVPLALVPLLLLLLRGGLRRSAGETPGRARPPISPNLALGLVSAALTAALFLLVLMLVRGWNLDPLEAAAVVSAIPAAALVTGRLVPPANLSRGPAAGGVILIAGGLAALALVP